MFAGLALEDDDDDNDDDSEEETPKPTAPPPKPQPQQRGPALPEADDVDDLDDADLASASKPTGVLGSIDPDDLAITIETLEAVAQDLTLFRSRPFKALREAIGPLAKALTGDGGGGGGRRQRHGTRLGGLDPMERLKQMDRDALNHRVLRAERLQRLEELQQQTEGDEETLLLTGGDDPNASLNAAQGASLVPFNAGKQSSSSGGTVGPVIPDGPAMAGATVDGSSSTELLEAAGPAKLNLARSCYVCKKPYRELHAFYAQMCMECADLNWRKRTEMCNLYGRVALVTGGRVKIGFRIVLKLLRCGCEVIASTRFPVDAVRRFQAEEDHLTWQHRLHVVGADLRDLKGLEALCDALPKLVRRLDIIINNACQTVRRPPQYYLPLLQAEASIQPEEAEQVERWTAAHTAIRKVLDAPKEVEANSSSSKEGAIDVADAGAGGSSGGDATAAAAAAILPGMSLLPNASAVGQSAALSQLAIVPGDEVVDHAAFPKGRTDGNKDLNQQLDLRAKNSWMLKLEEVSTPEMAEVLAINALAPAVINGRLKSFMVASGAPDSTPSGEEEAERPTAHSLKFIVNVSAMEGRFYKYKQPTHPHTNMAKAALNMMTRTSAADYAKQSIYMTAVDTGWINDEKPAAQAAADAATHNFQTPIDEIDAAARVLDPIIAPLKSLDGGGEAKPLWSGCFLKDYEQCEW